MKWIVLLALPLMAQDATDRRVKADEGTNFAYAMPRYGSLDEWKARREHLRKQILAASGLLPMPYHGPVRSEIFDRIDREGYSIEKVWVETMPGYFLGGNLYKPRGRAGKFPGIVSPHGHWKRGRIEDAKDGSIPARCINLARQGYVVFAYDMVGYNDTNQTPHAFGGPREDLYNFGPLGLQLWNSIRAVDFIESLPEVDTARIGATGASGGGTQTFLLTAVDDRIKAAVPVNMISGIMQGGSPCENAPGLRHDTFNVDIGAMMAPRPMLMVAATGDWTKNVPRNEYPAIKGIYSLFDAGPQVDAVQFDAPHNYNKDSREAMYTFFAKHFLGKEGKVAEQPYKVEPDPAMLLWADRQKPSNALDYQGVFDQWRWLTRAPVADRETLRYALSVETPAKVDAQRNGEQITLARPGKGDRVKGAYRTGQGTPVLALGGAAASGAPVLSLDLWTGKGRDTKARHFYTFHRTDAQNQVQDILTGLRWLQSQHPNQTVEIRAQGDAAIAALFAAAVADGEVRLKADLPNFRGSDEEFVKRFWAPGIQRVGGLAAALELTNGIR